MDLKRCPFCGDEIQDRCLICESCGSDLHAEESVTALPVLLGITMWLTWPVRPAKNNSERLSRISIVSYQRLRDIGSRLGVKNERPAAPGGSHQLVRFNVYNFGEQAVSLCAVALKTLAGQTLSCELIPSLVVGPGARYPLLTEITTGPVAEAVDIQVEHALGHRLWVSAQPLPRG